MIAKFPWFWDAMILTWSAAGIIFVVLLIIVGIVYLRNRN